MRDGFGVITPVMALALVAGTIVLALHVLWRGSSRTLFSVQEQRQLAAIARSAVDEACFLLQVDLDRGDAARENWMRSPTTPAQLSLAPACTRENTSALSLSDALRYDVTDVLVTRARRLGQPTRGAPRLPGLVDFEVTVAVVRAAPRHEAKLTLGDRRLVRLADDLGPYAFAGKHLEISPSPAGRTTEVR